MRAFIFILFLSFAAHLTAQSDLLQAGPMLGYCEMREVLIWVQTTKPAKVQIAYKAIGTEDNMQFTPVVYTKTETAHTAKLIASNLEPGQHYQYQLLIDEQLIDLPYATQFTTQPLWQWRTDPPEFSLAIGSCSYISEEAYDRPGKPYGGDYQIFNHIASDQPDLMLWLGDNAYLREVDWFTRSGILHRYSHSRAVAELQPLLATAHHYAIWDDHDFGPNDSDRSFLHKDKTREAFELFWGNPGFGLPKQTGGITTAFQFADIDFFLLDNRYYRTPNDRKTVEHTILGKEQLEWLIDALSSSRAPFKMVAIGGQVLNTAAVFENYVRHAPEERAYLLHRIADEGITGVIFLTGDRHHTELSQYTNIAGHQVYDLTVSPLTSGAGNYPEEANAFRVADTYVGQRNYGLLTFSGPRTERQLTIHIKDKNGEQLWEHTIKAPQE